jgi:hypothetical protein
VQDGVHPSWALMELEPKKTQTSLSSKFLSTLTTTIHPTEIASGIQKRYKKSFRSWNKVGVDMLAFKEGQEMLEICQVSRPFNTVQSQ